MKFTREQKIQALRREIALRRNVFARRVDLGKMTQEQADYEVAIMEEILEEYTFLTGGGNADIESRLDAFLAKYSARPMVIPSRLIIEATGCAPRQIGTLMRARGWRPVNFSNGARGWLSPEEDEPPASSNAFTAEAPASSNAFTAEAPASSNEFTAEAQKECDHRLFALRDLAQRTDIYLWRHLAEQMAERIEHEHIPVCGRCALVKNTILRMRSYSFSPTDVKRAVLEVINKKPELKPDTDDVFALVPEEVRAESDVVVEILNLLGGVASQVQLEKALRKRGYKQPLEVLQRVKPALADFVEVARGNESYIWRLR